MKNQMGNKRVIGSRHLIDLLLAFQMVRTNTRSD